MPLTYASWRAFCTRVGATVAGDVPVVLEPPPLIAPPAPLDVPHPGDPLPIIVHHLEYAWDDVSSWVSDRWHNVVSLWGTLESVTMDGVKAVVDQAINMDITAWSSFVNQLNSYTQSIANDLSIGITDLGNFTIDGLAYAENLAQQVGDFVGAILSGEIQVLGDRVTGLEHLLYNALDFTAGSIEAWAIDNIYHPLLDEITAAEARVRADVLGDLAHVEDWVRSEVNAETLARLAAVAGIAATLAQVAQWVADCGEPTCEVVGPRTDWGKWLTKFAPLAIWAMLAAVAAENPGAIESGAEGLARELGPVLERWVATFALGGGGFPPQPGPVGGAIGGNPLGL